MRGLGVAWEKLKAQCALDVDSCVVWYSDRAQEKLLYRPAKDLAARVWESLTAFGCSRGGGTLKTAWELSRVYLTASLNLKATTFQELPEEKT